MKIKKFKVALRKKEIIRNLKLTAVASNAQISEITPQLEETILKEMDRSSDYLCPASIFETFPIDAANEKFGSLLPVLPPPPSSQKQKVVAISIIVVTIGEAVEKEIESAKENPELLQGGLLHSLALEACNCSMNFVYRIIEEEAVDQECTLMPMEKLAGDTEKNIIRNFNTKNINVTVTDDNQIHPVYTSAAIARWLPKVKK